MAQRVNCRGENDLRCVSEAQEALRMVIPVDPTDATERQTMEYV